MSQTLFFVRALIVTGFYLNIVGFIKRFIIGDKILATIITKIIAIILAVIAGRVFCGWMCPFGFLFELMYKLRVKIFKLKKLPTVNEKIHNKLIYFKYVVLILVVLIYLSGVKIVDSYILSHLLLGSVQYGAFIDKHPSMLDLGIINLDSLWVHWEQVIGLFPGHGDPNSAYSLKHQ